MSAQPLAYKWSVLFMTDEGSIHPLRLSYATKVGEHRARAEALEYLKDNKDWLDHIDQIYPTKPTPPNE